MHISTMDSSPQPTFMLRLVYGTLSIGLSLVALCTGPLLALEKQLDVVVDHFHKHVLLTSC